MSRLEDTARLYSRLNEVAAAATYLDMFDRDIVVQVGDESICLSVQGGGISVRAGGVTQAEYAILQTDPETWDRILAGRISFAEAGGGLGGHLPTVAGKGSWTDVSWMGILTRLAQEWR